MALFGQLKDVKKQLVLFKDFYKVTQYLDDLALQDNYNRLKTLDYNKPFKQELAEKIFAVENTYKTKNREEMQYE